MLRCRASLGFAPEDFVVLFCGRLEPDKGIHKLLEAMENIHDPRIKLLIVGSPFFGRTQQSPFLRKLEQQAETLGDRVRFTGYVPNDSMPEYYRLADLVCVPTLVEEAAGLVAVEAMGLRPTGACHPQRRYAGISGRQPGRAGGP